MIKKRIALLLRLYAALDLIIVSSSFILACFIRGQIKVGSLQPLAPLENYLWLLLIIIPVWWSLFLSHDIYSSQRGKEPGFFLWKIIKVNLEGIITLSLFFFIFKIQHINRTLIFLFGLISICLLTLEKLLVRRYLTHLRKRGKNLKNILIVGTGKRAREFIERVISHTETGFRIIGCLNTDPAKMGEIVSRGIKIIGTSSELSRILHSEVVDEVVFALPLSRSFLEQVKGYLDICHEMGIEGRIIVDFPDYFDAIKGRIFIDELLGNPLISFPRSSRELTHTYFKNIIDFSASLIALVVLSPLMAIISLGIKLTSPGPIIFRQERSGLNGRKFILNKFRTMVNDAEGRRETLMGSNEMSGPVFKISKDPRVTRFGRFLRKTSLDELPQLFNVLKGDMSLVGPRPLPVYESKQINGAHRRRLSVKPGVTCFWQISGRNQIDFEQWMELDLKYIDNWSLGLDFKILLKTLPVVLIGKGAK